MSVKQAEWWVVCWECGDWVESDTWYEAMAVLLSERAPA